MVRPQSRVAHRLQHGVGDGQDLLLVRARGEDEVIGEGDRLAQVEDHDLTRLLAEGGAGGALDGHVRLHR